MKRMIKAVFGVFVSLILLAHSFTVIVYAIDFDAEQTFDSVFVVLSGNSLGSGFALGKQCVITNAHVVQRSSETTIAAYDGKEYDAIVYCKSDDLDIAVLFVPSADFTPLAIGNTSDIKIGDDVYAIGAPNGMSFTLTKGTLSSNKRKIRGEDYLQIDAALNEGNSGGPLLNASGGVIGMNTMKMNNSEGLGLAIPIDRILQYMKDNAISITDSGIVEVPEIKGNPASSIIVQTPEKIEISDKDDQKRFEHNKEPLLLTVVCVSVICNIIMLLLTLQYRSKWKKLKAEQSERTDFEIDIWE